MSEINEQEIKNEWGIDKLDAVYDNYYKTISDSETAEINKICATIYACMQTVDIPVLYGEFEVNYSNSDVDEIEKLVKEIEKDHGFDNGQLSNQTVWDYVFFDLSNNNVTAHAENFAHQLVEYYETNEEFRELFEDYPAEQAALATMYMYRNVTPTVTGPANHIDLQDTPKLISTTQYDMYDVIEAYHGIYEKPDISPALNYSVIDNSGVLENGVKILEQLEIDSDNIMYVLYTVNSDAVEMEPKTTALVLIDTISDVNTQKLMEKTNTNKHKFERFQRKIKINELLV